jgi:hypothetical protein
MTQGSLFTAAEVCPLCKSEGGSHVAGCFREPSRPLSPPIARRKDPESSPAAGDSYRDRSPAQRQQILELLEKRGAEGASNAELNEICFRYGARIFELRKMGHKIRTVTETKGVFRFVLQAEE